MEEENAYKLSFGQQSGQGPTELVRQQLDTDVHQQQSDVLPSGACSFVISR